MGNDFGVDLPLSINVIDGDGESESDGTTIFSFALNFFRLLLFTFTCNYSLNVNG